MLGDGQGAFWAAGVRPAWICLGSFTGLRRLLAFCRLPADWVAGQTHLTHPRELLCSKLLMENISVSHASGTPDAHRTLNCQLTFEGTLSACFKGETREAPPFWVFLEMNPQAAPPLQDFRHAKGNPVHRAGTATCATVQPWIALPKANRAFDLLVFQFRPIVKVPKGCLAVYFQVPNLRGV